MTRVKLPPLTLLGVAVVAVAAGAQAPGKIDFVRDVQPILRDRCVSCHGSDLRMGGLRLDRRVDALRGGTQTDIGPGNADGSRLYHRLVGTAFGAQMPPTGPLTADQVEIIKDWIDQGAEWPDEASGESHAAPIDPRTARLMNAALYENAASLKRLLAAGANPNASNGGGATPLMWAVPDVEKMRALLEAGADVDARTDEGRSALTIASGIVGAAPAVGLLLESGADVTQARASDTSPVREATRINDAEIRELLIQYGALAQIFRSNVPPNAASTAPRYDPGRLAVPTPLGVTEITPGTIGAAIGRSLPLLQDVGLAFIRQTGCVSCHHNSVVSLAVAAARAHGYRVDEAIARRQSGVIAAYLESWRERVLQNVPIAGGADTMSYLLLGIAAEGVPHDAATDAQAIWLKRRQERDGHWIINANRPPIESNEIEVTAASMRAIQVFAPSPLGEEYAAAVDRARTWLLAARAESVEERAFRLLGLYWARADAGALAAAAKDLLAIQRDDGGWSQAPKLGSDAYATGEALYALRETAAVGAANGAVRKGVAFLLRTQMDDGTWFVASRSTPIQAYFESGFPYGINQWVSAAATAWATAALALAQ
jgi:hypothetical protein